MGERGKRLQIRGERRIEGGRNGLRKGEIEIREGRK
jgi:hypothetical protein